MAANHEVEVAGPHTDAGKSIEQPTAVEHLVVHWPDTGVDEHEAFA